MRAFLMLIFIISLNACVSVPKEAPQLSEELGVELYELEQAHLNLVHAFFDQEREKIRRYVNQEWLPLFATHFFEEEAINAVWQQIVSSDNKKERLKFIVRVAPEIQQQADKKIQELAVPVNQLENELIRSLQQKYATAKNANQTITTHLYSAANLAEDRQDYLDRIGLTEEKTTRYINEAEQASQQLLEGAESIEELETFLTNYKKKWEEILANF